MKTQTDFIIKQLQLEIDGQPWHGPSLSTILGGIDAAQAARRVSPEAHSIWEILLHLTGWKREVTNRLRGNVAGDPASGDWPAVGEVTEERWRAAQADHQQAQRDLLDLIRSLGDERLLSARVAGDPTPSIGAGLSYRGTVFGLLQHDVYHAGQIAILKKMT